MTARGFSERERQVIYRALMDAGRDLFSAQGVKKTTVAELARRAGISQGSYYSFFPSKVHLWLRILEDEEENLKSELLGELRDRELTRRAFGDFLRRGLALSVGNPIIKQMLASEDLQFLMRGLPEEEVASHIQRDAAVALPLIEQWQAQGHMRGHRPEVIVGLMRAMFLLTLHRREIGEDVFAETMDLFIDLMAEGLVVEDRPDD